MKIIATITETIILQKEVELEVSSDKEDEMDRATDIEDQIKAKAYEKTIMDEKYDHGWEGLDCLEVNVEYKEVQPETENDTS